ncbi:TetR family transcriptional regulator [Streptacidiphilus sp. PB12-B1b]|uniref:TetR/AcrR family transcriptional regulator n=1 Tax=Streptacidiphilus sp. PB12-B1b TaxID=2705012 RepID=UPI0015F82100|nr:TetR/AcrR family transcriptional regulator [Streptacidiphilus sp. PB12-B1b]QMU76064.1 TetR family transcriptional regulator [Streptacidiphilus sp. PB12-B1b]
MSPRAAAVNEAMRARSRARIMQATVDLVDERGFEGTTLGDIAERAGLARGLVSYYFPGKRILLQTSMHRLMHQTLGAALAGLGEDDAPDLWLATSIDTVLGLAAARPTLMRTHLSLILAPSAEGFIQDAEQKRFGGLLQQVLGRRGAEDPAAEHAVLRSALMGACMGLLLPGAEAEPRMIRDDLFVRYGLDPLLRPSPFRTP